MKYLLHFISIILLFSCSKSREKEKHLIPKELIGSQIIINYNQEKGEKKKYMNGKRVYDIPSNGILNTKFKSNFGWFNETGMEFFLIDGDSLLSIPWNYSADTIDFFSHYKDQIGVMGFLHSEGTFSYVVDTINYELFKKKRLDYREDIFGKKSTHHNK